MRHSEWISVCTFALFGLLAWVCRLTPQRGLRALLLCNAGILLVLLSLSLESLGPLVRDWLPAFLILLAYWTAGAFVCTPSERLQRTLLNLDTLMLKPVWMTRLLSNRNAHAYFESAYLLCYPLIPAGVGVLYWYGLRYRVEDYWSVVLPSTYFCYLVQPLARALPPRLVCADPVREPKTGLVRRWNLLIHQHASIRFVTLPSAHVASTLAASFALIPFAPLAGALFMFLSVSIAVAAVAGRYHYAADVLLGAVVAVFVSLIAQPVT